MASDNIAAILDDERASAPHLAYEYLDTQSALLRILVEDEEHAVQADARGNTQPWASAVEHAEQIIATAQRMLDDEYPHLQAPPGSMRNVARNARTDGFRVGCVSDRPLVPQSALIDAGAFRHRGVEVQVAGFDEDTGTLALTPTSRGEHDLDDLLARAGAITESLDDSTLGSIVSEELEHAARAMFLHGMDVARHGLYMHDLMTNDAEDLDLSR